MTNKPTRNSTANARKAPHARTAQAARTKRTATGAKPAAGRTRATGRASNAGRANRAVTGTGIGPTLVGGTAGAAGTATPSARPSLADEANAPLLSRRNFLYGAVGAGAIAVAAGGGAAVYFATKGADTNLEYLEVPTDAVSSLDDFTLVDDSTTRLALYGDVELPLGSLVWCNSDDVAACLIPTDTGSPLAKVALLMLGSATYNVVLDQAVGTSESFEIYDVRASSTGIIWTEANILDGIWRIYTASIQNGNIGTPALADKGDSSYETPSIAAVGAYGFWQKQAPASSGTSSSGTDAPETEVLRVSMGSTNTESLFSTTARMATPIYGADDGVVVTPRSKLGRAYTCVTKIDAKTGEVSDGLTLPQSMSPFEVGCGENGLMFSFENIYNFGGGIANLGTYVPLSKVAVCDFSYSDAADAESAGSSSNEPARPYDNTANYSGAKWFRFSRTPTAAPAFCGNYLIVKSSYSVCGIDLSAKEYFAIDVDNGADNYGEYLATSGSHNTLVTYTSIDYKPVNDTEQKLCRVKIWKPVG